MLKRCVIGVDLGGTNVRAQAYYEDGSSASRSGKSVEAPSNAQMGTTAIIAAVGEAISQAVKDAAQPPIGVGLAIPGIVDDAAGVVRWAPNFGETVDGVFRFWDNVPVREHLKPHLGGLPLFMGNDANLAALGEYDFGTGRGKAKCLVMFTLGTGVGGGIVMSPASLVGDARGPLVLVGGNQGGAELGHIVVQGGGLECGAGSYGALEAYCGRDSIVKRAQNKLKRGWDSSLNDMVGGDWSRITPKLISEAAEQGDPMCLEVWEDVGHYLGLGIGTIINVFAPDVFALGGQIAKAGRPLLATAMRAAREVAIPYLFRDCHITLAEQIDDAGMLGGAALALEELKWKG